MFWYDLRLLVYILTLFIARRADPSFFLFFLILIMSLMSLHACAGSEPNALVYAAIIIPMMFAVLAALTLMCCKKYVKSLCFLSAAGCVTCSL